MLRYETLLLVIPEITKDESTALENQTEQLIKKAQGSVISFDRWGKYKLAYQVRKNDYGIYYLLRFEIKDGLAAQTLIESIRSFFLVKYNHIVMRNMTTMLAPEQSLIYQKPESLEDMPTRDVDLFLKENKMTGLLTSNDSRGIGEELFEEKL
jgi:small subunit ribosomal protein S6